MRRLLAFCFLASTAVMANEYPETPDRDKTPGCICDEKDPDYKERRYPEKIAYCQRNVSYEQRQAIYDSYNIPEEDRKQYTIDHMIPLSVGGCNRPENLWPEHHNVKHTRPDFETKLYKRMRKGEVTQEAAIKEVMEEKFKSRYR